MEVFIEYNVLMLITSSGGWINDKVCKINFGGRFVSVATATIYRLDYNNKKGRKINKQRLKKEKKRL